MKNSIRTAIVGCGGIGSLHLQSILSNPGFELVAACDINQAALERVPAEVAKYSEAAKLFSEHKVDLTSIVLPNFLYHDVVTLATEHGSDVFCEKPFGQDLETCRAMYDCVEKSGRRAWVSSQRKYLSHYQWAREWIAKRRIDFVNATITYWWGAAFGEIGWRGDRKKSGGIAVVDSGWHLLDCLDWFMGQPEAVYARLKDLETHPGIDDKAAIIMDYASGAVANATISYTVPESRFEVKLSAGREFLSLNYEEAVSYSDGKLVEQIEATGTEPVFDRMYEELLAAMQGKPDPYITNHRRALQIMEVVDACYRSQSENRIIRLLLTH